MQENMKRNILYSLTGMLIFVLAACTDDWFNNRYGQMPEGETDVNATVEFLPLRPALDVKTRTAGDAIKDINNLCVLLYDKEGTLTKVYYLLPDGSASTESNDGSFKVKDEDRTSDDAEGGPTAESRTQQASFRLSGVPYGNHYIYAVANMGNLMKTSHYPAIRTREGLKSIGLAWQAENWVSTEETGGGAKSKAIANNQMFGHFTTLPDAPTGANRNTEDALVAINKKGMTLHAWIRRAASKVTVAYDASALKEGVFIYLKSVQIKDIPTHCYLGKDNKVGAEDEGYDLPFPAKGEDMPDGEVIKYYEGDTEPTVFDASYPVRLSTGKSYYPWPVEENGVLHKKGHEETADALFFFENMQGKGPSKLQDADGNGELDHPGLPGDNILYPDYLPKDDVPYGTYIEVDAYYVSVNPEKVGSGNIKYRFMLGKNVQDDYNAERNHHYKLTLKFKNFANDADWHIEYQEPEPGIEVPNPYYISYLYNHSMMLPLKVKTGGRKLTRIDAVILDNRWAPDEPNEDYKYWSRMDIPYQNQWNGFLSLRKTKQTVIVKEDVGSNEAYYKDHNRGNRSYDIIQEDGTFGSDEEGGDGVYTVRHEGDSVCHVSIPMYTRAKQLIKETGYTGNNPYVAYQRRAEVRIVATLEDGTKISTDGKDLDGNEIPSQSVDDKGEKGNPVIYQVRRIVNPKGVWRSCTNTAPFHVQLKRLPKENETKFETFTSEGIWKAYVVVTPENNRDFIHLTSKGTGIEKVENDTVYGRTGSIVDFDINFNGTCGEKENRYAIVRVEYHNCTCYHLIFVRQGSAPDDLIAGGTKWHAMNMKTRSRETDSPLEEGSLFKFGRWDKPIDAQNNVNPKSPWNYIVPSDFKPAGDTEFIMASDDNTGIDKAKWGDIMSKDTNPWGTNEIEFGSPNLPSGGRIATYEDFRVLYESDDIEMGFGVLYGDGATDTADDIETAYEHQYWRSEKGQFGMRGCFVYNKTTGKNLFFPVGASGYGHRKEERDGSEDKKGVLRYASFRYKEFENDSSPLFYDLYMRPGAVYWLGKLKKNYANDSEVIKEHGKTSVFGWDFNYFTFDFFPIAAIVRDDACFIRCVD